MPVKISGHTSSDTYIVFLPGGPSGDGHIYRSTFPVFRKKIEPLYGMVYYDQRGSGNCQGVYDTATLNLEQLSEDLDKIIQVLNTDFGASNIFLMGYSYGGALGMSYLQEPDRQASVKGFISIEGAFDRRYQKDYQNKMISYWLDQWVAEGFIDDYKALGEGYSCFEEEDLLKCRTDSTRLRQKVEDRITQIEQYNQFKVNLGSVSKLLGFALFSQSNPIWSSINENQNATYFHREFDDLLISNQVTGIKTPVLFITGRYDTNVPVLDAQNIFEKIGTADDKKRLEILEKSGHLPMLTEPEQLSKYILRFIQDMK